MPEFILTQQQGAIFEIVLNRTDKRNAFHQPMWTEIDHALDAAEAAFNDSGARVLVIRAEGRAFSSGIDLEGFLTPSQFGQHWRDNLFPMTAWFQGVCNKIENHSLPVIVVMHGYCLGLGLELALAGDFRIAAERTKLSLPETRLGIIPDVGGTTRLLNLVGPSRAKEFIMTGRNIEAEEAERWGMVNYVVPKEQLEAKTQELAQELILSAPLAVSYTKRTINDMLENQRKLLIEAWAQATLIRTRDFESAVNAMITKTYPVQWEGK